MAGIIISLIIECNAGSIERKKIQCQKNRIWKYRIQGLKIVEK